MCRDMGIADSVIFVGNQNPVEEIYSIADLFLMTSESESFGLAALEAMACGMPVITSDSGALPELNDDGITGFVCPVGDSTAMAEKGLFLLKDESRWKQFSAAARKKAELYRPEAVICQYEDYYRQILEKEVMPAR